jgi:transposase
MKVIHLYVDNARYYRSKLVQEFLLTSRIQMHFLPAYSPNLNPIERLWKFIKEEVIKSDYTPEPERLKQRIRDFFANIGNYKEKMDSLINTKFQKLNPLTGRLQTSMR